MLRRTGRRVPARPGIPKSDEEEIWPYRDPGQRWEVAAQEASIPDVDWTPSDRKIGSIFLPDGEELEVWSDPVPFGFARWYETESEQAE